MQERWALKFACLGIGGIFVYDFYLFSDAMLYHQVNLDIWAERGVGYVVSGGGADRDRLTNVAQAVYDQAEKNGT